MQGIDLSQFLSGTMKMVDGCAVMNILRPTEIAEMAYRAVEVMKGYFPKDDDIYCIKTNALGSSMYEAIYINSKYSLLVTFKDLGVKARIDSIGVFDYKGEIVSTGSNLDCDEWLT